MYARETDYLDLPETTDLVSGQRVWIAWRGWMPRAIPARLVKHGKGWGTPLAQVLVETRRGGERWEMRRNVFATKEEALAAL